MFEKLYVSLFHKVPTIYKPFFGPELIRYHGGHTIQAFKYTPSYLESLASSTMHYQMTFIYFTKYYLFFNIFLYKSIFLPLIKNERILPDLSSWLKIANFPTYGFYFGCTIVLAWLILGFSRFSNTQYQNFVRVLCSDNISEIKDYDYSMQYAPVDYDARNTDTKYKIQLQETDKRPFNPIYTFLGNTLGRVMIMPGSLGIINNQVKPQLESFRSRLIEVHNGKRLKIVLDTNTFIDTILIDKRQQTNTPKNQKLVICTEGNAGFYEVGILYEPLRQGYSVIGWNRPSFGSSFGDCNVINERKGIKALIEYSRSVLKFNDEDIILFGWSIGGYATAVGATAVDFNNKTNIINNIVLDATFDHITPLADNILPKVLLPIGVGIVEKAWDFNVTKEILRYKGKVKFIRRLKDEIIATHGSKRPDTNRLNFLVLEHYKNKYNVTESDDIRLTDINEILFRNPKPDPTEENSVDSNQSMIFKIQREAIYNDFLMNFKDLNVGHNDPMPHDGFELGR